MNEIVNNQKVELLNYNDTLTILLKQGAQQLIQHAIEEELNLFLKEQNELFSSETALNIVRNGHNPERKILTGIGNIAVKMPKVRNKIKKKIRFHSSIAPPYIRRSKQVDEALPWLYLKGISTGNMAETLSGLLGQDIKDVSPQVLSQLKKQWTLEYKEWQERNLSDQKFSYLWVDGIYKSLRNEHEKLCILVVIGVNQFGEKKLLSVDDGVRESIVSWREVLLDLQKRGLEGFDLAIGDEELGCWSALSEIYPNTKQQHCSGLLRSKT